MTDYLGICPFCDSDDVRPVGLGAYQCRDCGEFHDDETDDDRSPAPRPAARKTKLRKLSDKD